MANTYTKIYIHAVFAVQNRLSLISKTWEEELYKYITSIIQNSGHKMLAINGVPNHLHVFFGMKPHQSISDLIKHIKGDFSKWINQKRFVKGKFSWQEGYGAFSYGHSQLDSVIKYVMTQKEHHKKKTFKEEYLSILKKFDVEYEELYILNDIG